MGAARETETRFQEALKRERKDHGWSQAALAELLCGKGVTAYSTTIAKLESGERAVRVDELVALATIFETSTDALLGHSAERADDEAFAVRELVDGARQALRQSEALAAMLAHRMLALDAATLVSLHGPAKTVWDGCAAAHSALMTAAAALRKTNNAIEKLSPTTDIRFEPKGGKRR